MINERFDIFFLSRKSGIEKSEQKSNSIGHRRGMVAAPEQSGPVVELRRQWLPNPRGLKYLLPILMN